MCESGHVQSVELILAGLSVSIKLKSIRSLLKGGLGLSLQSSLFELNGLMSSDE